MENNKKDILFNEFNFFSSGQVLIIQLISTIMLSNKKIFFIDEPEISMSIIWQDKLFNFFKRMAFVECSNKQFFIATHSHFMF